MPVAADICSSGLPTSVRLRSLLAIFISISCKKADEVFFKLKDRDDAFERALRLYAGAREQAAAASGSNKKIYEDKATDQLRALTAWLREHVATAVEVVHQGRSKTLL